MSDERRIAMSTSATVLPGRFRAANRGLGAPFEAPHVKGRVGMVCLIVAEASLFAVFVVAYLYDLGKSLSGPSPREVLSVPVLGTVCLLSSSVTVALAVRALGRGAVRRCGAWLLATVLLAVVFLAGTAAEWMRLITREGLTIGTNLFGTTV